MKRQAQIVEMDIQSEVKDIKLSLESMKLLIHETQNDVASMKTTLHTVKTLKRHIKKEVKNATVSLEKKRNKKIKYGMVQFDTTLKEIKKQIVQSEKVVKEEDKHEMVLLECKNEMLLLKNSFEEEAKIVDAQSVENKVKKFRLPPNNLQMSHTEMNTDIEATQKEKQNAFEQFVEFAKRSTCHGLSYLFLQKSSHIRRALWLLACLLCVAVYLYLCSMAVIRYFSYPSASTIEYNNVDTLEFPLLTLCNSNQLRKSYYERRVKDGSLPARPAHAFARQQMRLGKMNNTVDNLTAMSDDEIKVLFTDEQWATINDQMNYAVDQLDLEKLFKEGGFQAGNVLKSALVISSHGRVASSGLSTNVTSFISYDEQSLCHTFTFYDSTTSERLVASINESVSHYLWLTLNPQMEETKNNSNYVYMLYFHAPNQFELGMQSPTPILRDHRYRFSLSRKDTHSLPLPYGKTDCVQHKQEHAALLKYFDEYSQLACRLECMSMAQYQHCGCRKPGYPGVDDIPVCNYSSLSTCNANYNCNHCLPLCNQIRYEKDFYKYTFKDAGAMSLFITFKEVGKTEIRQNAVYPAESLFGELGGLMGMFIGASVVTIVEFVDFVLVALAGRHS